MQKWVDAICSLEMMLWAYSHKISLYEISLKNALLWITDTWKKGFYIFKINHCQKFLDNIYLFDVIQFMHMELFKIILQSTFKFKTSQVKD